MKFEVPFSKSNKIFLQNGLGPSRIIPAKIKNIGEQLGKKKT